MPSQTGPICVCAGILRNFTASFVYAAASSPCEAAAVRRAVSRLQHAATAFQPASGNRQETATPTLASPHMGRP
eukprot:350649-Chlamydomonas_euryale.AAC.6